MSDETPTPTPDAFAKLAMFKAKPVAEAGEVTKEIQKDIDKVAMANGFHSREAAPAKQKRFNAAVPKKQLNIKIPLDLHDRYYRMAEERGNTVLWQLLDDALAALKEKENLKG